MPYVYRKYKYSYEYYRVNIIVPVCRSHFLSLEMLSVLHDSIVFQSISDFLISKLEVFISSSEVIVSKFNYLCYTVEKEGGFDFEEKQ